MKLRTSIVLLAACVACPGTEKRPEEPSAVPAVASVASSSSGSSESASRSLPVKVSVLAFASDATLSCCVFSAVTVTVAVTAGERCKFTRVAVAAVMATLSRVSEVNPVTCVFRL